MNYQNQTKKTLISNLIRLSSVLSLFLVSQFAQAQCLISSSPNYPSNFSLSRFFIPETDWSAEYSNCTGVLTVVIKIHRGNRNIPNDIGRMNNVSLDLIKPDNTRLQLFDLSIYPLNFNLGVACQSTEFFSDAYVGDPPYKYTMAYKGNVYRRYTFQPDLYETNAIEIQFRDLPDELFGATSTLELSGVWDWAFNFGGGNANNDSPSFNTTKSITQAGVSSPAYNLNTVKDESCDHVRLTWAKPAAVGGCEQNNY